MLKKVVVVGLAASLVSGAANAESSKEEGIGLGSGAVLGAVVAGPVGAIIGAAFGAKVGDNVHNRNEKMDSLTASLDESQTRVLHLEDEVNSLRGQIAGLDNEVLELRHSASSQLASLLQAGVAMDLLFRTDEDSLSDKTTGRIQQLAGTLATMPDIQVRLDGFADERGASDYNQELSERRVQHVRDMLIAGGVPEARIEVFGHGETPAVDENVDSLALDRKVSLTLYIKEVGSLAANP